ncbi:MAG: acyl-CoA dehydrogenase family protein [Rhodobacteraceae bacterium]|nr:acyl-CoA dehydrogenase family protein [Paracoccaceae bacterium]
MLKRNVYGEDHELYRSTVRRFLEKEAVPYHDAWEEDGITPKDFWLKAGAQGLLCPQIPEAYGGPGGDYKYLAIVNEEAGLLGISAANFQVHSDIAAAYVLHFGTEPVKQRLLPKMVAGEAIGAIVMTEPNTGSDLQAVRTTAVRDGDHYVLNGAKTFISNGINADVLITVAKTDPAQGSRGISLFIVEGGMAGFERGKRLKKLGMKGQDTAELFFNDVRVPAENLLGEENKGFAYLMEELPQERLAIAIIAVAASQRAFDLTIAYTRERKAFKQRILDFQNTRFKLAEIKAELAAAWAYLDQCIVAHAAGELEVHDAAALKLWTTELQGRVMDECLQLFGGYGYMSEYPISRMYADARIQRIYGGTSEIMKEIIARSIDKQ